MSTVDKNKNTDLQKNKSVNVDSTVILGNPNLKNLEEDILYHLGLGTKSHDLVKMFGDVKFVCMGGTPHRMQVFAKYCETELSDVLPNDSKVQDVSQQSFRYSMYKIGPILAVSHGIGVPSLQILLHELIKLLHYAKVKDPTFFRIGTCGGIGIEPGSVVISNGAVDEMMNPYYEQAVCGEKVQRLAELDKKLVDELKSLGKSTDDFRVVSGKTMCAMDFYEGQGRLDGAFCFHDADKKMIYLRKLYEAGVRNIEMEATCFAAFTRLAKIKAAIVCIAFLDRFNGDQVSSPKDVLLKWETRPQQIVGRYIKKKLSSSIQS